MSRNIYPDITYESSKDKPKRNTDNAEPKTFIDDTIFDLLSGSTYTF